MAGSLRDSGWRRLPEEALIREGNTCPGGLQVFDVGVTFVALGGGVHVGPFAYSAPLLSR